MVVYSFSEHSILGLGIIELVVIAVILSFIALAIARRGRRPAQVEETLDSLPASDSSNPYAPSHVSRRVVGSPTWRIGLVMSFLVITGLLFLIAMFGFAVVTPVPVPVTAPGPVTGGSPAQPPLTAPTTAPQ